jgi:YHS domain-containing protein|tara:strand:+ start:601 stop:1179 length:579 start_codon:yes stop_codon:yes gene_type:complete
MHIFTKTNELKGRIMKTKSNFWLQNISVIFIYLAATFFVSAQETITRSNIEAVPLAIHGHDIISYYNNDIVQKGNNNFQAIYKGKRYIFTKKENQLLFAKNPEKYLPKFDGLCAHSASHQKMIAGNPSVYVVDQGNLYFFLDNNAKNAWNERDDDKVAKASKHWQYTATKLNNDLKAKKLWKEKNTVELFTF